MQKIICNYRVTIVLKCLPVVAGDIRPLTFKFILVEFQKLG